LIDTSHSLEQDPVHEREHIWRELHSQAPWTYSTSEKLVSQVSWKILVDICIEIKDRTNQDDDLEEQI